MFLGKRGNGILRREVWVDGGGQVTRYNLATSMRLCIAAITKEAHMKKVSVMVADENAFFARGRRLAALADAGKPIPSESVISFGDPADLLKMLTPARLALMSAVKAQPDSITAIGERLHRDRSAVKRDVDTLHKAGLLAVEQTVLAGHGMMKRVSLTAQKMRLQAELV